MQAPTAELSRDRTAAARLAFYGRIAPKRLAPLWEVINDLVPLEPISACAPHLWRYADVRAHLLEACALISAEDADRRVLILENPALRGESRITRSLFAGLQIIMPGEVAPSHRHVPAALRFVIEGSAAYTNVNGECTTMHPGDFVVTPSWSWHDHGHPGVGPMVWLDGLDMHMVKFFEASFREHEPAVEARPPARAEGASLAAFGNSMLPVGHRATGLTSPVFNYPYGRAREALEMMRRTDPLDPWHGHKLRYINPINGDDAIPTIATAMQLLPQGTATKPYRSTSSTVFVVVEGSGKTVVAGATLAWQPHDVFVVPSWMAHTHHAAQDAVVFSFSDQGVQRKLGFWREEQLT